MIYESVAHLMEGLLNGDKVRCPIWDQGKYIHLKFGKLLNCNGTPYGASLQLPFEQYVEPPPEQLYLWAWRYDKKLYPEEWHICGDLKTESQIRKDSSVVYKKIAGPF